MDEKIIKELKRGTLDMVLLSLLAEKQQYGYQLVGEISRRSKGIFGLAEGSLYPVLYRLEDGGLIEARWEEREGRGVPRKYYCVTGPGMEKLEQLKGQWQSFIGAIDNLLGGNKKDA